MTTKTAVAVTIAAGDNLSAAIAVPGPMSIEAVAIPAGWTAADLGVQVSADGVTYQPLYLASGSVYSVKAAAGKTTQIADGDLSAFRFVKLQSLTVGAATTVNQGLAVALTVFMADQA